MSSPFDNLTPPSLNDPNIPVIGRPYTVRGGMPTVLLQCTCEAKSAILLVGVGAMGSCAACNNAFRLDACAFQPGGQMQTHITTGRAERKDEPAPTE